ncbi:MAG: membrane protein insertion efficiency factor YidD [Thermoguttaceae bacterium]|nr:membrane protein insertion efficiency factor YidD [Thermoguttaceae bacterium]
MLGPHCRFTPTCSQYCILALRKYGLLRGSFKTIWRILRCNPYGKGGYDPP